MIDDDVIATNAGAWAFVDANAVPVSPALLLLGSGLVGLLRIQRRNR